MLSGSFKRSSRFDRRTQVTSFALRGDWLGIDALDTGFFCEDTVALQDSLVCCFPYEPLLTLLSKSADLQREFHRMLSRYIQAGQSDIWMLGCNAEQRVCRFLIDLKQRQQDDEAPTSTFELPMMQTDVASYLGLTAETVCRILARFERLGVLAVRFRTVDVLDLARLSRGASLDEAPRSVHSNPCSAAAPVVPRAQGGPDDWPDSGCPTHAVVMRTAPTYDVHVWADVRHQNP